MDQDAYTFSESGLPNSLTITIFASGEVEITGSDTPFTLIGDSTIIGFAKNGDLELVESYQIDRSNKRLLYSKSRVGTRSVYFILPDTIMSAVGDLSRR